MPESNANIHMLERLVGILGDLVNEMVFVGGSVAALYKEINDENLVVDIRPTYDVDAVVHIESIQIKQIYQKR